MKTRIILTIVVLGLGLSAAMAQKADRKAEKLARKAEQIEKVKQLIDAKTFVFTAQRALPQGFRSVDLTTNSNSVKFSPNEIDSYLPFFGRAYSAGYNRDGGIKFKNRPDEFTIEKVKNGYLAKAKVKSENDTYTLTLNVSPEGSATLSVLSNNRSSIAYNGQIDSVKE